MRGTGKALPHPSSIRRMGESNPSPALATTGAWLDAKPIEASRGLRTGVESLPYREFNRVRDEGCEPLPERCVRQDRAPVAKLGSAMGTAQRKRWGQAYTL